MTLKIDSVSKAYNGQKILDSIDLEIKDHEIMGFAGINGAGKTTTMKIASGVIFPTSGDVFINGKSILTDTRNAKLDMAWIPETPIFDPLDLPISLFLAYGYYFGKSRAEIKEEAAKLMQQVHLAGLMKKRIGKFSNGMKKRLMVALSLFQDPRNFLLDETFTSLDPEGARFLRENLIKLRSEGKAIMLSTHILSELEGLADKIAIIHKGKIVSVASMEEIMKCSVFTIKCDDELHNLGRALEEFGIIVFKDGAYELHLSDNKRATSWEIGKALENSGIRVISVEKKEGTIERYFFEKIGEI
jgi:ABC-2 type transport system ATP-binding protein